MKSKREQELLYIIEQKDKRIDAFINMIESLNFDYNYLAQKEKEVNKLREENKKLLEENVNLLIKLKTVLEEVTHNVIQ